MRSLLSSVVIAVVTIVALASRFLLLPPSWIAASMAIEGMLMIVFLVPGVYYAWGGPSCRADLALWVTALTTIAGSIAAELVSCSLYGERLVQQCASSSRNASIAGHVLFGLGAVLVLWGGIRYIHRRDRG